MSLTPVDLVLEDVATCNYDRFMLKHTLRVTAGEFSSSASTANRHNLTGYIVYPGLLNAHDHLLGNYYPRVGNGPYLCWKPWDIDLKNAKLYDERNRLSLDQIYLLSYYRQILSGVTTVCDHIPHLINDKQITTAYIRIIEQYCIAHEISSYELTWGEAHEVEIQKAKRYNIPFVTHLEEGFDEESLRGVEQLHEKKGIFNNSVLVHCIGCDEEDISLIAQQKASMVWCPNSNFFMFERTANIRSFLKNNVNVCLGTDSPMSGGIHILDELKKAQNIYQKIYGEKISAQQLFTMVTMNPATAFKLARHLGTITPGKQADFIVLKATSQQSPYEQLLAAEIEDIEIVVRDGIPLYFHEKHKPLFYNEKILEKHYERVRVCGKRQSPIAYLIGKPLKLKQQIQKSARFKKVLVFFPIEKP